jgi:hypothetical protein
VIGHQADNSDQATTAGESLVHEAPPDRADGLGEEGEADAQILPVVETRKVPASLELAVVFSADEEAVEYLPASAVAKIWKHAFRDEPAAVAQAESFPGSDYAGRVRALFLEEYREVKGLPIPNGYAFTVAGKPAPPNLMQRLVAFRLRKRKRIGNWFGTGAGKTLSAILASRVVSSRLTVVCCPNSVVEGWCREIRSIFPDSIVAAKTLTPDWTALPPGRARARGAAVPALHRYLVLNYEIFQQPDSFGRARALAEREPIDFVIIDEIHYAKQRAAEDMSRRRQVVAALTTYATGRNPRPP